MNYITQDSKIFFFLKLCIQSNYIKLIVTEEVQGIDSLSSYEQSKEKTRPYFCSAAAQSTSPKEFNN